ncbi:MAG TPA: UPF0149 family protein [Steroidobacteraceae bacterium]|nr:UPF0149 family protein [Steroidobacteraceae bacterium]
MGRQSNYAQIQRLMSECRAVTEPAEAHGSLAGALCATDGYGVEDWLAEILPEGTVPEETAVSSLRGLFEATRAALIGTQMQFELLIPDDDAPLELRAEALTLWCNGFVYGLGSGGAPDPERLPGDAGEIVRDLAQIMRAGVDEREGIEANESALAELVEFVRVGVQVVFEELGPLRQPMPARPSRQQLH